MKILHLIFVGLCLWPLRSESYFRAYLPAPLLGQTRSFQLKRLGCFLSESDWKNGHFSDFPNLNFQTGMNENDFKIVGTTPNGKTWQHKIDVATLSDGFVFFTADLDQNGQKDLILLTKTRGNGLAPQSEILTVLFDAKGHPVFTAQAGYFEMTTNNQIEDFLDLNHDGRAELAVMHFGDGYWTTDLYEARQASWQKVEGRFGQFTFPMLTRFTSRPNHKPVFVMDLPEH